MAESMVAKGTARQGVFISYAREDGEEAARALHARLAEDAPDVMVWLDRYEIEGGIGWWHQIEQALDRAEYLILIITPSALRSDNTSREWRSARQRGVCVYPVKGAKDMELDYLCLPNWMRKAHFYDPYNEWQKLIAHLRRGCNTTRIPFMAPPLPLGFIQRQRENEALLGLLRAQQLEDSVATRTVVLCGTGGFGKTTLATAICHDERIIDAFDDGVLWVTLGQSPNLLNELIKVYAALTGERPGFIDIEDAARELALRLERKNCLIVVDDVWCAAHVQPFLQGGAGCTRLITTRLFDLEIDSQRIKVGQMTSAEALQLLFARVGATPATPEPFYILVSRLGRWPLAIKLAGSAMRQRIERGDSLSNALEYIVRALDKHGVIAFDKEKASGREDAVTLTVEASLDLLKPEEQRHYAELAIFREDEAIPIKTVATLWQLDDIDSEDLAQKIDDLALAEFDLRLGTLRLHDVLRGFLIARLSDISTVHEKLINAWGDPYNLPDIYAWRSYTFHLRQAGQEDMLRRLLLDLGWLTAKLQMSDIHSLIDDFEHTHIDRVLSLIRDALRLSAPALAIDPQQLRSQLIGRTLRFGEQEIVAMREAALELSLGPWLRVLHQVLDHPGGALIMTLVGHRSEVTSLAIDTKYRQLVSASRDRTVRIWNSSSGKLLKTLPTIYYNGLGISAIASSGDGELVAVGGANGYIYMWKVSDGELLYRFSRDAGGGIRALALSINARIMVSAASTESNLRVWDIPSCVVLHILIGHSELITSAAISADGSRAVSGSDDFCIGVWNLRTGTLERMLKGHTGSVNAVMLTADGRYILSGSSDRTIKLWEADTGVCLRTLVGHTGIVTAVAMTGDMFRAISGASDSGVMLWDLHNGHVLARLNGHSDAIRSVIINDEGTKAATGSADCTIKLWSLEDLRLPAQINVHTSAVRSVVFSPDNRFCASGGEDGSIKIQEVESGRLIQTVKAHSSRVRSLAFTQDCACVLSDDIDDTYRLTVIETGDCLALPIHHMASIDYSVMSSTARYLLTSCTDRYVYLWDLPSGALIARYGTRRLFDHLISPSAQRSKLLETDDYLDQYFPGETVYYVEKLYMSEDGVQVILSAFTRTINGIDEGSDLQNKAFRRLNSDNACLLSLNTNTWEVRSMVVSQSEPISAFAIDANGKRLLWARLNHTLVLWDLERHEKVIAMEGHNEKVNALAFSRDGLRAFSCSRDRTLRAWNLQNGQKIAMFTADAALYSLALSSDDSTITVGDVAGRVYFLRLIN